MEPLIAKKPDTIYLHTGTNNAINESPEVILNLIKNLANIIMIKHPTCKVIISHHQYAVLTMV